jgi:beta-lactamase regulating signal transducer with metallopeptidase domain
MIQIIIDNLLFTGVFSSVIAVLLIFLSRLSNNRFSGKVFLAGWIIAMAALLLPLHIIQNALHLQSPEILGSLSEFGANVMQLLDTRVGEILQNLFPFISPITNPSFFTVTIRELLFSVWLLGVIIITALRMRVYIPFYRHMIQGSSPCENNWNDFIPVWLRSKISLREADIMSPIVFGFFHNIVIIPTNVTNESTLRYALTHEFLHIRRNDLLIKLTAEIAAIIQWFNPFAWIIRNSINTLCEVSCDEEVAAELTPEMRKEYAIAILDSIDRTFEPEPLVPPLASSFLGNEVSLKERLEKIVKYEKMTRRMLYLSFILLLIVTMSGLLIASTLITDSVSGNTPLPAVVETSSEETSSEETSSVETTAVVTSAPVITTVETLQVVPTSLPLSYTVTINGLQMTFPMAYDDFIALGWICPIDADIDPERYLLTEFSRNGQNTRFVMTNYGYETVPMSEAYVVGFEMTLNPNYSFTMAGNIQFGTTKEQVIAAFGYPFVTYDNTLEFASDAPEGLLNCNRIQLKFDGDDKVSGIYMQCLDGITDVAPPDDILNKEVPDIVLHYETPTDLGTGLSDRIFSIDGDLYRFPCPIKAFLDNGWEITEGADVIVKASDDNFGAVIEKDGYSLTIPMRNYTDEPQPVRNCFIIEMDFNEAWNFVPLEFADGITHKSTLEEVLEAYGEPTEAKFDEGYNQYLCIYGTLSSNVTFLFWSDGPEEIINTSSFQYYYSYPY